MVLMVLVMFVIFFWLWVSGMIVILIGVRCGFSFSIICLLLFFSVFLVNVLFSIVSIVWFIFVDGLIMNGMIGLFVLGWGMVSLVMELLFFFIFVIRFSLFCDLVCELRL